MHNIFYLTPLDEKSTWILIGCIVLMVLDIISGVLSAFYNNEYSSKTMREGLYHKIGLIMILFLGWFCDTLMGHVPELNLPSFILVGVGLLIIFMEITSVLENIIKINPDVSSSGILSWFKQKEVSDASNSADNQS